MSNELVYYRNPALDAVGTTTRSALERHPGWYECDADGNRLGKRRKAAQSTENAGQKVDENRQDGGESD